MSQTSQQHEWYTLYRVGAIAALVMIAIIPIQIVIFAVWQPPTEISAWYALFERNPLLGLLSLDLLYLLNNILLSLMYLALYIVLRDHAPSLMLIGIALGFIGIAIYYASNPSFEMWTLARQYAAANDSEQNLLLAAGMGVLTRYTGTAFNTYYVLNAITLLIIAVVMLKTSDFSRATAYWGLISGVLMSIPSTVGTIGLIFSIASLIPWIVFSILVSRQLLRLANHIQSNPTDS